MLSRPEKTEYSAHFEKYIQLVPDGNIEDVLASQTQEMQSLLGGLSVEQTNYRYAEGKWSIKETVGHVTDTERFMAYRLLIISRGLDMPLPGFDQDALMAGASFATMQLPAIFDDYLAVRRASLTLIRGISADAWLRLGTVSGGPMSARALAWIIAGHERHHLNLLRDKYLAK
jgi:hypothetical protein